MYLSLDDDECTLNTDGCDHNCINTFGSFVCTCNSGFFLGLDQKTCQGKALLVGETLLHVLNPPFNIRKNGFGQVTSMANWELGGRDFKSVMKATWGGFEGLKVTLEHESYVAFPSSSKQLFQNLELLGFVHYARIFLQSLQDFSLSISQWSKTFEKKCVIRALLCLWLPRPPPN